MSELKPITEPRELQWRLIYSIIVAGKNAAFARQAMERLLADCQRSETPFQFLSRVHGRKGLAQLVRIARTGNYRKTEIALSDLTRCKLDLLTCAVADLENIFGVGPKTARFFLLWTRPDHRCAALDVHILRWLGTQGHVVPRQTPQTKSRYAKLERIFLEEADKRGMTPRQLDWKIWSENNVGGIRS